MSEFWLYDMSQLFSSFELVPKESDTFEQKLNTITRLSLLLCLIISAYNPVVGISTFLIIVSMVVSFNAIYEPTIEQFEEVALDSQQSEELAPKEEVLQFMREYNSTRYPSNLKFGFPSTQTRFCNDEVPLMLESSVFPNETLRGSPTPKTSVPPIVATPSHDITWKANDFVTHSAINARTNFDANRSGYQCGFLPTRCKECVYSPCRCMPRSGPLVLKEEFTENYHPIAPPRPPIIRPPRPDNRDKLNRARRRRNDADDDDVDITPIETQKNDGKIKIEPCFESARRDNLLTQTLQPGVFQKSHVGEPIQSNIGITFTQSFAPTAVEQTGDRIKFTQFTPESIVKTPKVQEQKIDQSVHNVYDPRFTGYGTSNRSYVDGMGRPQYFYDDIDAVTMPNYITRSNVDVFPWAATYGSDVQKDGTDEYRQLANNAFTDSTILFRTELQERLMRKRNAEMWQRRAFPISTMNRTSYLAR